MYIGFCLNFPLLLFDFKGASIFLTDFREILEINLMEVRREGAELLHSPGRTDSQTNGQTEMTKIIVAFRNFSKRA